MKYEIKLALIAVGGDTDRRDGSDVAALSAPVVLLDACSPAQAFAIFDGLVEAAKQAAGDGMAAA